jgi:Predicted site-specific integrase-resolvase
LNEKRKGFLRLRLLDRVLYNEVDKAVKLYEDRLTRFGSEALKKVFEGHGTTIEVLNQADAKPPQQELVKDLIATISHFSGKLYGMRSGKQREVVKRAKELFSKA